MQWPKIVAAGTTTTSSGTTSAAIALPKVSDGTTPARVVMVTCTTLGYIKFGGAACTTSDILVTATPLIVDTHGVGFYTVLQETAAAKINVVPVEA